MIFLLKATNKISTYLVARCSLIIVIKLPSVSSLRPTEKARKVNAH
jgi:hypothetical protein